MATPGELGPFADRRLRFAAAMGAALAIVAGPHEARRNGDVHYEFRQSSDFFFLTGFDEPDAVAVINPAHAKERYVLFVRPRDRETEIWTGHRAGVEGAVATYGADAAYPIDQLDEKLREYLVDRPLVYYRLGQRAFDGRVTRLIVASGPNACILHYGENTRRMQDGELLLIDAGCEWGYHAADITRTFPVNGRFTAAQRTVYEVVLRAQLAGLEAARPGNRYEAVHEAARRVLTEGLVALGVLPRGVEDSLAMHHYREFY